MRRFLLLLALAFLAVARVHAQSEVAVGVSLYPDPGKGPRSSVRVSNLLDDPDWKNVLEKSYPIRLEWSVQLWRAGGFLGGASAGPKAEWKETIQKNAVMGFYEVTTELPGLPPTTTQFRTQELLALSMGRATVLEEFGPDRPGNWSYRVTLKLSTLTDEEISKLGDPDPSAATRLINKFLYAFSQPSRTLIKSTPTFRWR